VVRILLNWLRSIQHAPQRRKAATSVNFVKVIW